MAAFFVMLGIVFPQAAVPRRAHRGCPRSGSSGLFQKLNGSGEFDALTMLALRVAGAVVCPLALVLFSLAFHRSARRMVEQPDIAPTGHWRPVADCLDG